MTSRFAAGQSSNRYNPLIDLIRCHDEAKRAFDIGSQSNTEAREPQMQSVSQHCAGYSQVHFMSLVAEFVVNKSLAPAR